MKKPPFTDDENQLFRDIAADIETKPDKYREAGKWLDEYRDEQKVWSVIENKCKAVLDRSFKREDWQESPSFIMPDSTLGICKVLQAVAVVDMDFLPGIEDLQTKYREEANSISSNFKSINERLATRAKIVKYLEKKYPTYQYHQRLATDSDRLFTACEELLELKEEIGLIKEETKLKVCLLA